VNIVAMVSSSDDHLVAACLEGDPSSFRQLVRNHERLLRTVAYSVVGDAVAMEDALQEGLLKAYRSLGTYRTGSDFRAWLCRIVRNAALDELRKTKRNLTSELRNEIAAAHRVDDEVTERLDLMEAIFRLPEKQRTALLLVDHEGLDYEAAAKALDIPPGTVASRVNAARAALRITLASHKDELR
jgi:RNA polymerase sigma-70 factor (ECF subfamily)